MAERQQYNSEKITEESLFRKLDGAYTTLTNLHPSNTTWRYRHSPFMPQPPEDSEYDGIENIAGHMWLATELANFVFPILPNASRDMDNLTVLNILSLHDIGEIAYGDVSAYLQINGYTGNRKEREDQAFHEIISPLPQETKQLLFEIHQRYEQEKNNIHTTDKEALFAKMIDTIQGNHNVLTYSPNFLEYKDVHEKIVNTKLLPFAQRLETVLAEERNEAGAKEINIFTRHHLSLYEAKGVSIPYPSR